MMLISTGKYDGKSDTCQIVDHPHIVSRLKEQERCRRLKNSYLQISDKTFRKAHPFKIADIKAAIESIVNKQSGENSIKKYQDLRISEHTAVSKQADEVRRMIEELIQDNFPLMSTCTCTIP